MILIAATSLKIVQIHTASMLRVVEKHGVRLVDILFFITDLSGADVATLLVELNRRAASRVSIYGRARPRSPCVVLKAWLACVHLRISITGPMLVVRDFFLAVGAIPMVAMMQLIETVVSSVVVVHISDSNVRLSTISM